MDIKKLNKIAKACRRLGVKHLKTPDVEIELASDIQEMKPARRKKLAPPNEALFNEPDALAQQSQALTDNDLLFWSSESTQ
jgi:hypothetical protein